MVFAKMHTAKEKSRTPRAWRDFCWAAFLAGGVFFLSGLMYGVLAGVAVPLQDPTSADFTMADVRWWMFISWCVFSISWQRNHSSTIPMLTIFSGFFNLVIRSFRRRSVLLENLDCNHG